MSPPKCQNDELPVTQYFYHLPLVLAEISYLTKTVRTKSLHLVSLKIKEV